MLVKFLKSKLIKIADFVGISLGYILPMRSIDSIRSKNLKYLEKTILFFNGKLWAIK